MVSKTGDGTPNPQQVDGFPGAAPAGLRGSSTLDAPLLMVDIDGVISLFGTRVGEGASGSCAVLPHAIDGMIHFLSADAAAHLLELAELFELVWASGWEERAEEHLPRLLGLPAGLAFLRFERAVGNSHAHWKLEAIERHAGARPLAWIDDSFNAACHRWAAERAAPTLLVRTDPAVGLSEREAALLRSFAADHGARRTARDSETAAPSGPA